MGNVYNIFNRVSPDLHPVNTQLEVRDDSGRHFSVKILEYVYSSDSVILEFILESSHLYKTGWFLQNTVEVVKILKRPNTPFEQRREGEE